jgi:hypothetical protein
LTITPVNDAPAANDDSYTTDRDMPLVVPAAAGVLANDTDVEGDALTASVLTEPAHGTLALDAGGAFTYSPAADYAGPDSFTYVAHDGQAESAPAMVRLTVAPVNHPPVAELQDLTTAEDTPLTVSLMATDPENDPLTFTVLTPPEHGVLSGTAPDLTYTPEADYHGPDSFTFQANDGQADSNVAVVSLEIAPVNDAPLALAQSVTTAEDTPAGISLGATDVDGDDLTYVVVSGPGHGTLSGTAPDLVYTPVANYHGADNFTFTVGDGQSGSALASVTLAVAPVNDAPSALDDSASTPQNTGVAIAVLANDSDVDGDPLEVTVVTPPGHGLASANADGTITYEPVPGYTGPDDFTYAITDGQGGTDQAIVTLIVTSSDLIFLDDFDRCVGI